MSRRTSLPGAAELFRSTRDGGQEQPARPASPSVRAHQLLAEAPQAELSTPSSQAPEVVRPAGSPAPGPAPTRSRRPVAPDAERRPTGRERHDEKITVYVSAEELMDLERARLTLRGTYGLAVDRGRIVREALAVVLADLEEHGDASTLVRRLHGR